MQEDKLVKVLRRIREYNKSIICSGCVITMNQAIHQIKQYVLKEWVLSEKELQKIVEEHFTVNKREVILRPNLAKAINSKMREKIDG